MEAKTSMESYDHKPFPDVSGLRTSASGRNGSFIVSQSLDAGIFHQIQDIEQTQGWETNTLITAAWGVLLVSVNTLNQTQWATRPKLIFSFGHLPTCRLTTSLKKSQTSHSSTQEMLFSIYDKLIFVINLPWPSARLSVPVSQHFTIPIPTHLPTPK